MEDFHRGNYRQATVVAACFPDIISAISVGGEVTPSDCEWSTDRPRITNRVVDVHLIFGGVKIPTQDIHQVAEVDRPGVACGRGYLGNRGDGISPWVIDEGVLRVGENATGDISPATCVN